MCSLQSAHRRGGSLVLHKFSFEDRESKPFVEGISSATISDDGKKLLYGSNNAWFAVDTRRTAQRWQGQARRFAAHAGSTAPRSGSRCLTSRGATNATSSTTPDMHGRDWDAVYRRYAPLVPFIRHRADLNYVMDQVNGELSVGHSFVFGGDMPEVERPSGGALGADLEAHADLWRIARIYTFESWNPQMVAPLDRPGLKVEEGHYLLSVDGVELTAADDPYRLLDGTGIATDRTARQRQALDGWCLDGHRRTRGQRERVAPTCLG